MLYNQISEVITYTYDTNNLLIQTESIKTLHYLDNLVLLIKYILPFYILFLIIKNRKGKQ